MTTTFKLASTTIFEPRNVNHTVDSTAAKISHHRAISEASSTGATRLDAAAISASSVLSVSSIGQDASRSVRVEALRQSINTNTYSVPAHEVASAIIDSLL